MTVRAVSSLVERSPLVVPNPTEEDSVNLTEYAAYRRREVERKADAALHALDALTTDLERVREDVQAAREWEASYRRTLDGAVLVAVVERVAALWADVAEPVFAESAA
jgi:hypothetical protein